MLSLCQTPGMTLPRRQGLTRGADTTLLAHDDMGPADAEPWLVIGGGACRHPDYLGDLGLGAERRLVLPHLRGVGRSPLGAPEAGSAWAQRLDMVALLDDLDVSSSTVVGHSAGARLAIALAVAAPDRVRHLVLVAPPAGLVGEPFDLVALRESRIRESTAVAEAWTATRAGPDLTDDTTFTTWQRQTAPLAYATWDATARAHARVGDYSLEAARRFLADSGPADRHQVVRDAGLAVTLICGDHDLLSGHRPMEALGTQLGASLRWVRGSGHYPWIEQPAAFAAQLRPCLEA